MNIEKRQTFVLITAWCSIGLAIFENISFYLSNYLSGMYNTPPGIPCLLFAILWPTSILLLMISFSCFLVLCFVQDLNKKKLIFSVFSLYVALLFCIFSFPLLRIRPAGAQVFLKGFEKWVIEEIDTHTIQSWINTTENKYWESKFSYGQSNNNTEIPGEFPAVLKNTKLQYIRFERSEFDNSKIIHLEWGGGMFHWSLIVGGPDMKMPEQKIEWFSGHDVEFRRILGPGVYIFSRG